MQKHLVYIAIFGLFGLVFFSWPPLPAIGTKGKIGKYFYGYWDGSTVLIHEFGYATEHDIQATFRHYPEIKSIVDHAGRIVTAP